jgi:O-succinylbenzoic acid--CoA ligase
VETLMSDASSKESDASSNSSDASSNASDRASASDGATMIDWTSKANHLLLNPRMAIAEQDRLRECWQHYIESDYSAQIGIVTSGSSGDGSGSLIVLSKAAFLANAQAVNDHLQVTNGDIWMKTLPSFHVGGLSIFARAYLSQSKVIESASNSGKWEPATFHQELLKSEASLLSLVPTQLYDLIKAELNPPPRLRAVIIGGARLSDDLLRQALERGWPVLPSYGLTECASQVATAAPFLAEPSSLTKSSLPKPLYPLSRPLPLKILSHVKLRISEVDQQIEIASPALLTKQIVFSKNGEATLGDPTELDTLTGVRWLKTDDRGCLDEEGHLCVLGRTIDFVKVGGEGVVLSRLEERLEMAKSELRYTDDAVILAAKDDRLGASLVLLSDCHDSSKVQQLLIEFNNNVMPFERIRSTYWVEKMPRSAIGKLLRFEALAMIGLQPAEYA